MAFERFVEVGRVVMITFGPDYGKLAVIVEIIDHGRVLVDGPTTGVKRQAISFKRATLTPLVLEGIPRGVGSASLTKLVEAQDIAGKFAQTAWAKKISQRKARAALSDFDRFKVMVARKKRSTVVGKAFAKAKKASA